MPYLSYEGPGDVYELTSAGAVFIKGSLPTECSQDVVDALVDKDPPHVFTVVPDEIARELYEAANVETAAPVDFRVPEVHVAAQSSNTPPEPELDADASTEADSGGE